jgi:hypothetical protein
MIAISGAKAFIMGEPRRMERPANLRPNPPSYRRVDHGAPS